MKTVKFRMSRRSSTSEGTALRTKDALKSHDLKTYVDRALDEWVSKNGARAISALKDIAEPGDPISFAVPEQGTSQTIVRNDVSVFPWFMPAGMPDSVATQYVGFLLRATYAALIVNRPELTAAFSNGSAVATLVPVVGVRAGMQCSIGSPPEPNETMLGKQMYYDPKRARLWLRSATGGDPPSISAWRTAFMTTPSPDKVQVETMLAWAHVAPLVAVMSSSECYTMGSAYTVPFVQHAISEYFATHMSPEAYARARLDQPLVWNVALQAAVEGYEERRVMAWAADPVMAICAERRILVQPADITASRAREGKARMRCASITMPTRPSMRNVATTQLWSKLRAPGDFKTVLDDDDASVATALMVDAGVSPDDSVSVAPARRVITPPRNRTPPIEVTPEERQRFHDMLANVRQADVLVPSVMRGVDSEAPVKW
jgi:hypothetical protein